MSGTDTRAPFARKPTAEISADVAIADLWLVDAFDHFLDASSDDRDFAIVHALLEDIGKILCYGKVGFTTYHDLGHEFAGILLLDEACAALEIRWASGATGLRSLLAGLWKNKGRHPILAVGKLVQAFDRASVEQDRRKNKEHRRQP